jgi:hypothetical protein
VDNSSKYIIVPIIDELSYGADETFSVILHNAIVGVEIFEANRIAYITILENEEGFSAATPIPEPDKSFLPTINK